MEYYLSDILDIVVEYIYRNKSKNKLINSFYLPVISFININKKYYQFDFCKKHIGLQYIFSLNTDIKNIIDGYISAINNFMPLPVSFDPETFFDIISLLISLCKSIMHKIEVDIQSNDKIKSYHNELDLWVKSECFSFINNKNPQTNYYSNI